MPEETENLPDLKTNDFEDKMKIKIEMTAVLFLFFFLAVANPFSWAWNWSHRSKIISPEGEIKKMDWSEAEILKDPVKRDLGRSDGAGRSGLAG